MSKRELEYKDYYVAFLDILGFSNLVNHTAANEIHKLFKSIRLAKKYTVGKWGIESAIERTYEETKLYFFSDSIIYAIPCDAPQAFQQIASNCMFLQHSLWCYSLPVWVRGAIVRGKLHCGNSEVFGPALIEAYRIEESLAKYPRIIMLDDTYRQGIAETENGEEVPFISDTQDGLKMVETLKYFMYPEIENIRKDIVETLRAETNAKVREKYLWIKDYYNESLIDNKKYGWKALDEM